jgi:hypothetical protein
MARIYSIARIVHVWLGAGLPGAAGHGIESCDRHTFTPEWEGALPFHCPPSGWQDLTDTGGNFWWQRLWTVQRFALAEQVAV